MEKKKKLSNIIKYFLVSIFIGCSFQTPEIIIYGVSYGGNCDLTKMPTLVLDPDWTKEEVDIIKSAAKQWEDAVGINFGKLEYSNTDCDLPDTQSFVKGCIVKTTSSTNLCKFVDDNVDCGKSKKAIYIFVDNTKLSHLEETVAHELGHWTGLNHPNADGYLMSVYPYEDASRLTSKDIELYEETCLN